MYSTIKDGDVIKFIWKNIVCQFEIPQMIVFDNGPQFDSLVYKDFCKELKIKSIYSNPRYPQSNGQTKATDKSLIYALKQWLSR